MGAAAQFSLWLGRAYGSKRAPRSQPTVAGGRGGLRRVGRYSRGRGRRRRRRNSPRVAPADPRWDPRGQWRRGGGAGAGMGSAGQDGQLGATAAQGGNGASTGRGGNGGASSNTGGVAGDNGLSTGTTQDAGAPAASWRGWRRRRLYPSRNDKRSDPAGRRVDLAVGEHDVRLSSDDRSVRYVLHARNEASGMAYIVVAW